MFNKKNNNKRPAAIRKNVLPKNSTSGVKFFKWGIAISVIFLAGVAISQFKALQVFPVQQVRIEGEFVYLQENKIQQQVAGVSVGGFFDVDIASIRDALLEMQWVDDVFVRREWPSSIVIRVVEKQPVASWNKTGVLTSSGHLFYPENKQLPEHLVELEGPVGRHQYVLSEYNKLQSQLYTAEITITKLSQNQRRSWKLNTDEIEIHLGRKDVYKKIQNLAAVYKTLLKPEINKIEQIDFRYTNGFAVKWQQAVNTSRNVKANKQANNFLSTVLGTV